MTRAVRRRHLFLWGLSGVIALVGLAGALLMRTPVPNADAPPPMEAAP